jgi:glycine/D-amino acid oxidase-like deaminating enzyme
MAILVQAKYIVNATGFEVVNFIPKKIVDFYCTYAIISENQSEQSVPWKDQILMWNSDDPYLYLRLTKDNRILIGGRDERFSNTITRELFLNRKAVQLQKDFKKIYPNISFKTEFSWCGTFGKTKDALPYIGTYVKTPNTYYALGFGGNGITFSVLAAEIITSLIQGKDHEDAALFLLTVNKVINNYVIANCISIKQLLRRTLVLRKKICKQGFLFHCLYTQNCYAVQVYPRSHSSLSYGCRKKLWRTSE